MPTQREELDAIYNRLFDIANDFAIGRNGAGKNGATAVELHGACNRIGDALKALDDPTFAKARHVSQVEEHLRDLPGLRLNPMRARAMAVELCNGTDLG